MSGKHNVSREVVRLRGQLGTARRDGWADADEIKAQLDGQLSTERFERTVADIVARAPRLTAAQAARIRELLPLVAQAVEAEAVAR
ncbi:hypothetical protein ACFWQL_11755 [Amycolatopsis thermoflava]|uniref:hypothetical protein n=1 Tax=Amycolatopsis thermoflava TaxID=84480 RepID=UPI003651DAA3